MGPVKFSLRRIREPYPFLSVEAAKEHLRQQDTDVEDNLIKQYIRAAERFVENDLGISLCDQTWELALDCFPRRLVLPRPPLLEVVSVKYTDTNGDEQTVDPADYVIAVQGYGVATSAPAFLRPPYGASWPSPRLEPQSVRIRYRAGFYEGGASPDGSTPAATPGGFAGVPEAIRSGLLLVLADLHQRREITLSGTISSQLPGYDQLVSEYRVLQEPE